MWRSTEHAKTEKLADVSPGFRGVVDKLQFVHLLKAQLKPSRSAHAGRIDWAETPCPFHLRLAGQRRTKCRRSPSRSKRRQHGRCRRRRQRRSATIAWLRTEAQLACRSQESAVRRLQFLLRKPCMLCRSPRAACAARRHQRPATRATSLNLRTAARRPLALHAPSTASAARGAEWRPDRLTRFRALAATPAASAAAGRNAACAVPRPHSRPLAAAPAWTTWPRTPPWRASAWQRWALASQAAARAQPRPRGSRPQSRRAGGHKPASLKALLMVTRLPRTATLNPFPSLSVSPLLQTSRAASPHPAPGEDLDARVAQQMGLDPAGWSVSGESEAGVAAGSTARRAACCAARCRVPCGPQRCLASAARPAAGAGGVRLAGGDWAGPVPPQVRAQRRGRRVAAAADQRAAQGAKCVAGKTAAATGRGRHWLAAFPEPAPNHHPPCPSPKQSEIGVGPLGHREGLLTAVRDLQQHWRQAEEHAVRKEGAGQAGAVRPVSAAPPRLDISLQGAYAQRTRLLRELEKAESREAQRRV